MANFFQESTSTAAGSESSWITDIWAAASQGMKTYFDYDIQREQAKIAKAQIAAGYNSGGMYPSAYDYTRFTQDGGLAGGLGGLKGDQVFLLGLGAIAVFAIARSR